MSDYKESRILADSSAAYINRELSWLSFAARVVAMAASPDVPLVERIRFVGITGMLHDEFFMKRMSGLKRQISKGSNAKSIDGRLPQEIFALCQAELRVQEQTIARQLGELLPLLSEHGCSIRQHADIPESHKAFLQSYFKQSVLPILTPLAVDAAHPFPFISNFGLNIAVELPPTKKDADRFVRIKVPGNRPRWVALPDGTGFVPLEQVIAANLELMFPNTQFKRVHFFRVTRGAEGSQENAEADVHPGPGSIVRQVTNELKARRFAGVVRLQVDDGAPKKLVRWLQHQLNVTDEDTFATPHFLGTRHLSHLQIPDSLGLRHPPHAAVTAPRLRNLDPRNPAAIFDEISRGDILLHHPYESFDSSVLRFLESAALDPAVLAIKLTIYRTSSDSPIVRALADAARRGKQVAVVVEITASFDEAPNIAWGQFLEREGVHVSYGVERLKTHVKLALVVREEPDGVRSYLHAGTGNYHTSTARMYEDLGVLTSHQQICAEAASVFNALTGGVAYDRFESLMVAPKGMRERLVKLIRRESAHALAGRPCGIRAKMNQLQDTEMIQELYRASSAGVPITLLVRGLCCLRPGVPGLSDHIRVTSVVGRFLEHSRIYEFKNGGDAQVYIGSADLMKRNLNRRVETLIPILDPAIRRRLEQILNVYDQDNASAWDCGSDGAYVRRTPAHGEPRREAQQELIRQSRAEGQGPVSALRIVS